MRPVDIIERVAAASKRQDREQVILNAFLAEGNTAFFTGVRLALDPFIPFHVSRVAEVLEDDGADGDLTFAEFVQLASRLHRRELCGDAARAAIHTAAERCHVPTWNQFYRRILLKDLIGLDAKLVNKVLRSVIPAHPEARQHLVPMFKCQLAQRVPDLPTGRKLVDATLDGKRTITVLDRNHAALTLYSRCGAVIDVPELDGCLRGLLSRLPGSIVFDGELVSQQKARPRQGSLNEVRYGLFDVVPLADFQSGYCSRPQRERRALLEALHETGLWSETAGRVFVLPQIEVDLDTVDGRMALAEFRQRASDAGYDGLILKDPDAPYTGKRSTAWLKYTWNAGHADAG